MILIYFFWKFVETDFVTFVFSVFMIVSYVCEKKNPFLCNLQGFLYPYFYL